jgi:hypothetical protein
MGMICVFMPLAAPRQKEAHQRCKQPKAWRLEVPEGPGKSPAGHGAARAGGTYRPCPGDHGLSG